jgi:hypothetical protein
MKNSIFTKFTWLLALCAFIFTSVLYTACTKDVLQEKTVTVKKYQKGTPDEINSIRKAFAETLSKAIYDTELRKYVHARMLERFNTDYEMVYIAEKDKIVSGGKTLSQVLASYADEKIFAQYGKDFFDKVTDLSPLLSITMPELETWDATKWNVDFVPNVAAVLEQSDINTLKFITFSERQGSKLSLRSDEPDEPTLGVWDAESTYLIDAGGLTPGGTNIDEFMPIIEDGDPCEDLFTRAMSALNSYQVTGITYYLLRHNMLLAIYQTDCLGGNGGGGNGGAAACVAPCERDCETLDESIKDFRINGWQVFTNIRNQWFESRYVFHGDLTSGIRNSLITNTIVVSPFVQRFVSQAFKKGDLLHGCSGVCDGTFKDANFRFSPDWDEAVLGSPLTINWSEVDPSEQTFSFSVGVGVGFKTGPRAAPIAAGNGTTIPGPRTGNVTLTPSFNTSFSTKGAAIVQLGSQPVFYCDPLSTDYNTGSVTFHMK